MSMDFRDKLLELEADLSFTSSVTMGDHLTSLCLSFIIRETKKMMSFTYI